MPLVATGLCHAFGSHRVLDGAGCTIEPGTITAIVGPNGAGKTTLVRILAGLLSPDAGRVLLAGQPIGSLSARERARRITYLPQQPSLAFAFPVRSVVGFGVPGTSPNAAVVEAALDRVGLADRADEPFGTLSAGQQQRVGWARALCQIASGPGFLLADEPTSALDPKHVLWALATLQRLSADGVGIAIVLHDLTLAARVADRALILGDDGRVVEQGPAEAVLRPEPLGQAFGAGFVREQLAGIGPVVLPLKAGSSEPDQCR